MKRIHWKLLLILAIAVYLRLWKLDQVPISMFGDELDVGYHAYSILKTGKDYSGNPWPLHFQSLAEWRTPLYLYSSVPTVAVFGITPLGVRLPAAIFGVLSIFAFYLLIKQITNRERLALMATLLLTISPWHIQYSRAGFEVTQLLFLLLFGLYAFFRSFEKPKWLVLSLMCLALMPWVYSTAKLFLPLLLAFLFILYGKQLLKFKKSHLISALLTFAIIIIPIAYSTVFGGGSARFNYVSVFTDPTLETEVGVARQTDARVRGEWGIGLTPNTSDRVFHNKFLFWFDNIERNYLESLSADFLFNEGDLNLRHSPNGIGQFYRIEVIPLLIGLVLFFTAKVDRKYKLLIGFWILAGIIPASITRDGGRHATRLILILPPLVFLIAYGVNSIKPKLFLGVFTFLIALSFLIYQHNYWNHNPWDSERWWHAGWSEAINEVKNNQDKFDKVIITTADEPPWIFFAAHAMYDPVKWHQGYPFKKTNLDGFGEVSFIDKYYFTNSEVGIYELGKKIDQDTLYLASAKEVNVNLIAEPERVPGDLILIKSIAFPSGEPAFYLLSRTRKE